MATPLQPLWANLRSVREIYGLSEHRLTDLVASGVVRSAKFGPTQQASRLFCVSDIENALMDMAAARALTPRRSVHRPTRRVTRREVQT